MRKLLTIFGVATIMAACVAILPAAADHQGTDQAPRCTQSFYEMVDNLAAAYGEVPLVGTYMGTEEVPTYLITVFVNSETGSWTLTQSDPAGTCGMASGSEDSGGIYFDLQSIYEKSKRLNNPDQES